MKKYLTIALAMIAVVSTLNTICSKVHHNSPADSSAAAAIAVGDIITFGHCEQDNDTTNGKEPIEWRVLDKNDEGQLLVISEKVLDAKPYNTTEMLITWEESTIRSWLNGYDASYNKEGTNFTNDNFIDTAFTAEEKAKIVASNVPAHPTPRYILRPDNSTFDTSPGNATTDKIFLLSVTEANNYFSSMDDRMADATRYAVKQGVYVYSSTSDEYTSNGTCTDIHCNARWWLRSPGCYQNYAALVYDFGGVENYGDGVNYTSLGVRPALWVNY